MAGNGKSQAIEVYNPDQFAIFTSEAAEVQEVLADNLAGSSLSQWDLRRVSVPAGKSQAWTVPGLEGETVSATIEGVIIYFRDGRSYWPGEYEGGNAPPACSSDNSITGIGRRWEDDNAEEPHLCQTCPFAVFGSNARGTGGQACKQTRSLFIVREHDFIPIVVSVPPSSLKAAKQYFIGLAGAGLRYHGVVTRLGLETTKNAGGIAYPLITFSVASRLTPEQKAVTAMLNAQIRPAIEGQALDPSLI